MAGGADLHLHSRHSDGADEPERIVELAAQAGLQAISLTDHDTLAGLEAALEAGRRLGLRVLAGVEFSAEFLGHEVHLLAYGFDCHAPALLALLEASRKERETRTASMVDRLNRLGIPVSGRQVEEIAAGASLGRPHLAEALLRAGVVTTSQEAFDRYLNPGRPAFVARRQASLDSVRRAARASGGVLVLAHPHLNLSSGNIHSLVDDGIDGLETDHPKLKAAQARELVLLAQERGLLATGGSDYHGERRGQVRIGSVTVPMQVVERIEAMTTRRIGPQEPDPPNLRQAGEL
jgi:predicted metal-dependent phosphoesterase TrpH